MLDLTTLRQDYLNAELSESDVNPNPLVQFASWFKQAQDAQVPEPNAMTLATVDAHNQPSARIVLIKEARQDGFVWFTNYNSRKGHDEYAGVDEKSAVLKELDGCAECIHGGLLR